MQRLWVGAALALALMGCRSGQESASAERTDRARARLILRPWIRAADGRRNLLGAAYSGYPGPVGPVEAGAVEASPTPKTEAGAAVMTPPSTAMPSARPFYPLHGGATR